MLPTVAQVFERLPRALRRHKLMQAWMRLTGEDTLQLVRIRDKSFGYADMSDGFLRLIVIDQDFESDFFKIADRLLVRGGTFVDIGANHGLLSFGLGGKHGHSVDLHLFEPNRKLVASIQKTRSLYPGLRLSVTEAAEFERNGVVAFEVEKGHSGASHIAQSGSMTVASVRLDDYIAQKQVQQVDLLKLDIEGFELPALRSAKISLENRTICAIYFEYCEKWLRRVGPPGDLLAFIDSVGFTTCFCRSFDLETLGAATHTLRADLQGHGLPLLPISGYPLPATTDLFAAPRECVVPFAS